jgi:DNA-binding CsgD family transcriptional regulator
MFRLQVILGVLFALVLAGSAVAQTTEGDGNTSGGGGNGNSNSGAGAVPVAPAPTAKPKPKPAPTRAPAPAPTRAPVATVQPTPKAPAVSVPAPKATAKPKATPKPKAKKQKPAAKPKKKSKPQPAAHAGCLSSREQAVLQRRAAGNTVAQTAAALDITRGQVRVLQRRAVDRLLADGRTCELNKRESQLTAAARKLDGARKAASNTGTTGALTTAADIDLTPPKKSGPSGLLLLGIGALLLLIVVGFELRKQLGLAAPRQPRRWR